MHNREVYRTDPSERKLVNEGVANVNDSAASVLRYELETFVCDGQYGKGTHDILETYLNNIERDQQPAVWVGGFYGSGKSHLVKMLRTLWSNDAFDDGATPRGIANLPREIEDQFKELSTQGKRHGGLFAASGTLGAESNDKSVRLALLSVIFRAAGLPTNYPRARFVMWLKAEGIYDAVRAHAEAAGYDWREELENFHVAEGLHAALVKAKPHLFASPDACAEVLINRHPTVRDVSSEDMVKAIRLALTRDGKFPLTLVVLDEVQQYIGGNAQRSIDVQEAVEACCKQFGGKLMFIGTGQTAVTGTNNLRRLEGRFTVRIQLSDADVDTVIRKVILAKQPSAGDAIEKVMQANLGEISRHLADTSLKHRQDDTQVFAADYPILPVRRRFWESALQVLDQTGTASQLRNQLSLVHKAIQTNLDDPLGNVIPADYLYRDLSDRMLQARALPRKVHDKTVAWLDGGENERLTARACGLVFLINKIAAADKDVAIKPTADTVADLMVADLRAGSGDLRARLPGLMDQCELLLKVGDEYRIQTEESAAWHDEFRSQQGNLNSEAHRVEAERDDRIKRRFLGQVRRLTLSQGASNVPRDLQPVFDSELPNDCDERVCLWVRNGWTIDANSVMADARLAGNQSPILFVFIPKRAADGLRHHLIDFKAATATLDKRGVPNTPEGTEARAAMETTRQTAEAGIDELLDDALSGARVFQAGGNEIQAENLQQTILEAGDNAVQRLYPQFDLADHPGWAKVYEKSKEGVPDALEKVGGEGEVANNPVCKAIMAFIAGGKNGAEIRAHFESPPYGWSRDAIDGALWVLLVAGLVRAEDERGQAAEPTKLERRAVGKSTFKVEATTISAIQRVQIRKLFQKLGINVPSGGESGKAAEFVQRALDLADRAGGDAPKPAPPDTAPLEELRLTSGNKQLLALYNQRDELAQAIEQWRQLADGIEQRYPLWSKLERLMREACDLKDADVLLAQADNIRDKQQLLDEPDPMTPLIDNLTQLLRERLNELEKDYTARHKAGMDRLAADESWEKLAREQRHDLLAERRLTSAAAPQIKVGSTDEVLQTVEAFPIGRLADRVVALPSLFREVATGAAEELEPDIQTVALPHRLLREEAEVDEWLEETRKQLLEALKHGPVSVT
jgi:hypothetical protein